MPLWPNSMLNSLLHLRLHVALLPGMSTPQLGKEAQHMAVTDGKWAGGSKGLAARVRRIEGFYFIVRVVAFILGLLAGAFS